VRGPWNNEPTFEYRKAELAVDGGSGMPEMTRTSDEETALKQLAARTQSNLTDDPPTGAELGMARGMDGSSSRAQSAMGHSSTRPAGSATGTTAGSTTGTGTGTTTGSTTAGTTGVSTRSKGTGTSPTTKP
jgi:Mn-containing catalase